MVESYSSPGSGRAHYSSWELKDMKKKFKKSVSKIPLIKEREKTIKDKDEQESGKLLQQAEELLKKKI